ncbi:hypothetical protein H4R18_004941 [Coemansia javaensis]|uniref:Beta-flanking protein n=1 Tax=Coemansia javaensis TaxID=2761396 RepID=A0A9W8LE38_9FUNG|nr:hypothetical protein H4R18_004941 [Coemansia javaensis]
MDFGKLLGQAKGAYDQYQGSAGKGGDHNNASSSGSGFDFGQAASLAKGFLSKDGGAKDGSAAGGLDFAAIAAMASGLLGDGSKQGSGDMLSSVLKMASGSGGFDKGHASHDEIKASYHGVYGQEEQQDGGLASKGQQAMGLASAYKAFKKFNSGGAGDQRDGGQNQLVTMALAEAKKLFAQHSSAGGSADEKETMATAVQAAMKLFASK